MGTHERKEREKEHRREEILDAAQRVFFEKGLVVATMDEIAETAELSKGTLYLYYKSKEDLYLAVMMRGTELLFDMFAEVVKKGASVTETLIRLGDAYIEYFNNHKNYFRMLDFLQTPQFHKQVSEGMKQSCEALNQDIWDLVNNLLKRGIEEGTVRPDLNPVEVSIIIWSSATTLLLRIDREYDLWKEKFHLDLVQTVRLSNSLLFDAILTEKGRTELATLAHTRTHR
jgi:TetR/AcrR family transcriptional regulator